MSRATWKILCDRIAIPMLGVFLISSSLAIANPIAGEWVPDPAYTEQWKTHLEDTYGTDNPSGVVQKIREISANRPLNYKEAMDLASSYFAKNEFEKAAGLYEAAGHRHATHEERARAFFAAANAHAINENWKMAGQCANLAQRFLPESEKIAQYRLVAWTQTGNKAEMNAALEMNQRLNLDASGVEVLDPGTVAILVACGKVLATVIISVLAKKDIIDQGLGGTIAAFLLAVDI